MSRRRGLAATLVLASCLCTLTAGTAEAAFSPLFDLSATGQTATAPQVAVDADGNAHFVWASANSSMTSSIIQTRRRTPDGTLGAVQDLSAAGGFAIGPEVAVDADGNAHFVWVQLGGSDNIVQTRRRAADGTLGAVQDLSAAGGDADQSHVAVDAAGNADFVWHRNDAGDHRVQTRRRAANGTLAAVQDLSAPDVTASFPQVAVDPAGDAEFVWLRSDEGLGGDHTVQARRRAAAGALGAVQDVAPTSVITIPPQVAIDAAGNAHFAWLGFGAGNQVTVRTRRLAAGGTLGAVQDLSAAHDSQATPQVAVDADGNAHFVWEGLSGIVQARRRAAAGTLGAVQDLSAAGGSSGEYPQLAVDAGGNAHFVWARFNGSHFIVEARRRAANGTLGAVEDLSAAGPEAVFPQVAAQPGGGAAAAVWQDNGGGLVQGAFDPGAPPVIFVPGFVASKLKCATASGDAELWPHIGVTDRPRLGAMELAADGVTDAGDGTCTGPVQPDGVLESVAGSDVHGSTLQFLDGVAPGANYVFAWDWRRSPEQALADLDALVDDVSAQHGGQKVAILAHSFGGLVTRWYIDDPGRAQKVERALIVGTPSWGSPKALFPLATGQETPAFSALDPIIDDEAFKSLARNMTGGYFLYPSGNYGTWVTVQGRVPSVLNDQQKLVDYVNDDLLGNGPLLDQALDAHTNVLDGWKTNGVDVRALVGTGVNTVVGVDLLPGQGTFQPDAAELHFGNGDETVPARSAVQGTPGTANPLGDDIPLHYACGVTHVPLAGDAALTAAGADGFLASGDALTAPGQPCSNGGFSIAVFDVSLGPALTARRGKSFSTAEAEGQLDLIRFPEMTVAATNDRDPVSLEIPGSTARVVVRRLDGETQGAAQSFGPFPSGIKLTTGAGGAIDVDPIAASGGAARSTPSGGGAAAAPRAFGARTLVTLKLAAKRIPAKGPLKVRIANANGFQVTGTLAGQTANRVSAGRKRRIKLRSKSFRIAAHAGKTVKLTLPRSLRKLLRRKRVLKLRVTATIRDPAGNRRSVRKAIAPKLR